MPLLPPNAVKRGERRSPRPALSPSVLWVAVAIHVSCHRLAVTELQHRRCCTLLLLRLTKPSLEEEVALPPSELAVVVAYTVVVSSSFCYYLLIVIGEEKRRLTLSLLLPWKLVLETANGAAAFSDFREFRL
ncbi:uncharacterized protein LOC110265946 [Arachis ipaensis]|uniref:uncharacterized protein LOC110265946 n=1 Tax=Arachis ipaensis TaxID=130454 RepID=UPI000A2B2D11|nr:uncharacterized protein LOC110265946 [Arachis ipaensis]XP_020965200.1 uncharacterized protein LOC110265946 [Arachis ipaensis]